MNISVDSLQQLINILMKKLLVQQLKIQLYIIKNQEKNYTNQLLKNLRKEKHSRRSCRYPIDKLIQFRFLLCIVDIYSKYAQVIPIKDEKGTIINNAFQKFLNESNRKLNKIWVAKGSELYNRSMKSLLQNNDIEMYLMHNEGKSVIAERFIRTLKNKIHKHLISVSKNFCIDTLDDLVYKYKNTYHSTIKIKLVDVKLRTCIYSSKVDNDKDPKFKISDTVRISKYKNILAKGYTPNWFEEIFVIKKVKNTVPWIYVVNDLNGDEIVGAFTKTNLKKQDKKNLELKN